MADKSRIEWTDATWNPVTGCTKISPGCDNCYAERFSERFRGVTGHAFENGFDLTLRPERLSQPLEWKAPRTRKYRGAISLRYSIPWREPTGTFSRCSPSAARCCGNSLTTDIERKRRRHISGLAFRLRTIEPYLVSLTFKMPTPLSVFCPSNPSLGSLANWTLQVLTG